MPPCCIIIQLSPCPLPGFRNIYSEISVEKRLAFDLKQHLPHYPRLLADLFLA